MTVYDGRYLENVPLPDFEQFANSSITCHKEQFSEDAMTDRHRSYAELFRLLDLFLVCLSFVIATVLTVQERQLFSLSQFLSVRTRLSNFGIFLLALTLSYLVLSLSGLYRSRRLSGATSEVADIAKGATLTAGVFMITGMVFSVVMIDLPFVLIFLLSTVTSFLGSRLILRSTLRLLRMRGRNIRYMLILGTNQRAIDFARRLNNSPHRGYRILGFVDDEWEGMTAFHETEFQVVSSISGLTSFLRTSVVDEITIYLPFASSYGRCYDIAQLCQEHGIVMHFTSDLFGSTSMTRRTEEFDGEHFITAGMGFRDIFPSAVKRALDIVISLTILVVSSPILLVAGAAIKLTSKGDVLFLQDRVGVNKRTFKIFKLRTMVPDAEMLLTRLEGQNEVSGPVFKIRADPRITLVGKFLRASSIDELPQLLNVLIGEMSLVGPRPLPLRDVKGFALDWQRRRFSVKPGITCLWQVGGRSSISFDQWMLLDMQYMDEWSIWLDFKIMLQTIPAVFRGSGAM